MMHCTDIVVSICDSNRKSLREYSSEKLGDRGRAAQVHIPFETEYQLFVKNNGFKNIRLDIDIDGANVSNDGIIVNANQNTYLERFINSQNKFKFVPISNSGVSDQTSKENGIVTVVAHYEKAKPQLFTYLPRPQPLPWYPHDPYWNHTLCGGPVPRSSGIGGQSCDGGSTDGIVRAMNTNLSMSASLCPPPEPTYGATVNYCANINPVPTPAIGQAGATVEGSKSHQQFITVPWEGDDDMLYIPVTFKFKLLGISNESAKDWQELERLKKKLGVA